jgi:hypothetical protein
MKLDSITTVLRTLNAAGVRYLVVGGLAVIAHGHVRLTRGIDVAFAFEEENYLLGLKALATLGYQPNVPVTLEDAANHRQRQQWIEEKGMLVLPMRSERFRDVSVNVFVDFPLDLEEELHHAEPIPIGHGEVSPVMRLEGLIKMKEVAGREKDLLDLKQLRMKWEYGTED